MSRKKNQGIGWIVFIVIIGVMFLPMFCRVCMQIGKKKPKQNAFVENNTVEVKKDRRYHLRFNDEFKKGLAVQDDLGISILIAVDCSGSMDDYPASSYNERKYVIASEALTEIMGFLENFYRTKLVQDDVVLKVGILKFSGEVEELYALTEMNNEKFANLKVMTSNINNFRPNAKTAIGRTLESGAEILSQSGTIFKSLIVITDGENTAGRNPEEVLTAIVNNLNNKSTDDFPIYTDNILVSFVGFDIDSDYFSELQEIGSRITSADNKEELKEALKNIFIADITKLESAQ